MIRVQSTGATSIMVPVLNKKSATVRRDEWLEVEDADDLRYLLAPTPNGAVIRSERVLAPYYITAIGPEPVTAKCRIDWEPVVVNCEPGIWTEVDRVAHHMLRRKTDVLRIQAPADLLAVNPTARILIQRDGGLGDLLFLTAGLRALRRKFPEARLYMATKTSWKPLMLRSGLFEDVFDFMEGYDHAPFDMDCDLCNLVEAHPRRMQDIRFDIFADALGVSCDDDYDMLCVPENASADHILPKGLKNPVAIDLRGSVWVRRPSDERCQAIVRDIVEAGFTPVGVMYPKPNWWLDDVGVDLNGCSSEDMFSILNNTMVLSVDTGTLHAAIAMKRPVVGLFGPIPSKLRVSDSAKAISINSPEQCSGCAENRGRCSITTKAQCFDSIPIDWITAALEQVTRWH